MRRSARLRSVMLRATKMLPWNCGSSLSIAEPVNDTGMVWPARVRTTVSRVSWAACASSKSARSRSSSTASMLRPSSSSSLEAEQLARCRVRELDDAVGRGDEHRVRHAVEHAVQIPLADRRLPQPPAHALERLLQPRERILGMHLHRAGVVAVADALDVADEGIQRPLELAQRAPGDQRNRERTDERQRQRELHRQARAGGARRGKPTGEAHRRHGRGLLQAKLERRERRRCCRAGNVLHQHAHRHAHLRGQRAGSRGRGPLPAEQHRPGGVGHDDRSHRGIVHEGLQPAGNAARVPGAHRARDRIGGVRGDAARPGLELRTDTLARGLLGKCAQAGGIGVMPVEEECRDRNRGEQRHQEGGAGIAELEAGRGQNACRRTLPGAPYPPY